MSAHLQAFGKSGLTYQEIGSARKFDERLAVVRVAGVDQAPAAGARDAEGNALRTVLHRRRVEAHSCERNLIAAGGVHLDDPEKFLPRSIQWP